MAWNGFLNMEPREQRRQPGSPGEVATSLLGGNQHEPAEAPRSVAVVCGDREGIYQRAVNKVYCQCPECEGLPDSDRYFSLSAFEIHGGRQAAKQPKRSIKIKEDGNSLLKWLEDWGQAGQRPIKAKRRRSPAHRPRGGTRSITPEHTRGDTPEDQGGGHDFLDMLAAAAGELPTAPSLTAEGLPEVKPSGSKEGGGLAPGTAAQLAARGPDSRPVAELMQGEAGAAQEPTGATRAQARVQGSGSAGERSGALTGPRRTSRRRVARRVAQRAPWEGSSSNSEGEDGGVSEWSEGEEEEEEGGDYSSGPGGVEDPRRGPSGHKAKQRRQEQQQRQRQPQQQPQSHPQAQQQQQQLQLLPDQGQQHVPEQQGALRPEDVSWLLQRLVAAQSKRPGTEALGAGHETVAADREALGAGHEAVAAAPEAAAGAGVYEATSPRTAPVEPRGGVWDARGRWGVKHEPLDPTEQDAWRAAGVATNRRWAQQPPLPLATDGAGVAAKSWPADWGGWGQRNGGTGGGSGKGGGLPAPNHPAFPAAVAVQRQLELLLAQQLAWEAERERQEAWEREHAQRAQREAWYPRWHDQKQPGGQQELQLQLPGQQQGLSSQQQGLSVQQLSGQQLSGQQQSQEEQYVPRVRSAPLQQPTAEQVPVGATPSSYASILQSFTMLQDGAGREAGVELDLIWRDNSLSGCWRLLDHTRLVAPTLGLHLHSLKVTGPATPYGLPVRLQLMHAGEGEPPEDIQGVIADFVKSMK